MCRGKPIHDLFEEGVLHGQSPVGRIPYIGPYFKTIFEQNGLSTVDDVAVHFSGDLNARELETRIASLFRNLNADRCKAGYHVSDINVCGFNNVLKT